MARINLLPWRDDRRQIRKREFWTQMAVAAGISAVAVYGGMMFMDAQLESQQERNTYLTQQIAELDKKIVDIKDLEKRRDKLLKKKEIIENLQADRALTVHLFEQLAKTIPDGVVLTNVKQTADTIQLDGKVQSESRVAQYMRNLDDSPFLKDTDLNIVQLQDPAANAATTQRTGVKPDTRTSSFRKGFTLKISVDRPKDLTVLPDENGVDAPVIPEATPVESTAPSTATSTPEQGAK